MSRPRLIHTTVANGGRRRVQVTSPLKLLSSSALSGLEDRIGAVRAVSSSRASRVAIDMLLPFALSTKLWRLGKLPTVRDVYGGMQYRSEERIVVSRALLMSERLHHLVLCFKNN